MTGILPSNAEAASYCGVDVGQSRVYVAVLDMGAREFRFPESGALSVSDAVGWILARTPRCVGIDSPPRPNAGLLRDPKYLTDHAIDLRSSGSDRRVAEWRLGIGGCYSTRGDAAACPAWMRTGMELFGALEKAGYPADVGAGGSAFEIHPTYGFRSLVGVETEGLRVRTDPDGLLRPKLPTGSTGHAQRLALLRLLCDGYAVRVDARAISSIDWMDAMFGAALGMLRERGGTVAVGAPDALEGAITIPARPLGDARDAVSHLVCPGKQTGCAVATTKGPSTVARGEPRGVERRRRGRPSPMIDGAGMVLRLGEAGIGVLTQERTLETLASELAESAIVLPVGTRIGPVWAAAAEARGLTVLLAFGRRIRARLNVTKIIASKRADTPVSATGCTRNPWPLDAARNWFVADDVQFIDRADTDYLFQHSGEWRRGFTAGQSAWIRFRDITD